MSNQQRNKPLLAPKGKIRRRILLVGITTSVILAGVFLFRTNTIAEASGVINDYTKISTISNDSITVSDASNFSVNDKVLLIQMKGAIISDADNSDYGNVISWESAGVYEFNYIKSISGNTIVLNFEPCKTYDTQHAVQLIRVPEYDSVRVSDSLKAMPWNGTTGGVLVLFANDRIRLNGNLLANGKGFKGGSFNGSATGRSLTYVCDVNSGRGGRKGEGIVEAVRNGCRGKLANGGGGGNDHNGGGGGGGNFGSGGTGGHGWKSNSAGNLSDIDKGGLGGLSLENLYNDGVPRLFMGGGGGGGHQNNGASFPGGRGGGIVIIITPELIMEKPVSINANGADAQDITINDGSSGGGAAGSVLLDVDSYVNPSWLKISVKGGDGADITTGDQHGPGGGGGGGLINTTSTLHDSVKTKLQGGMAGIFHSTKSSHIYDGTPHGATPGHPGAILSNLVIQKCSKAPVLDLNGNAAGRDYQSLFYPGGPDQTIFGSETDIDDEDDIEMSWASVTLENPVDASKEFLRMNSSYDPLATGITATISPDGHSITLRGQATLAEYQAVLEQVVYNDTSSTMDRQDRFFSVVVNDGGRSSNIASITMSVSEANFPVEWLFFKVEPKGEAAKLEWATATEQNSYYYEIQRSGDGENFQALGQVEAAGNSQTVKSYNFLDDQVSKISQTKITYRIKQVDIDGKFEYSQTATLNLFDMRSENVKMKFPNPVSQQLPIEVYTQAEFRGSLSIVSLNGQVVKSESISGNGFQKINMNVGDLSPGVYLLNLRVGGQTHSKKLIIQR
ncbi:MAG: T9SS type A sorting domain-containing protein [Bacteroidia bacterium]|nr:T9SS type A sorting domain-containing protein [Bacteroidia bacterium]